ncbi:hypothetical protein AMTRI_Chr04g242570 [Amborella trichopoda]
MNSWKWHLLIPLLCILPQISVTQQPQISTTQPFNPTTTPTTDASAIPAFPEQSQISSCPLDLPDDISAIIATACGSITAQEDRHHRNRCCPVLAASLYAAHARTVLLGAEQAPPNEGNMPVLPDDSRTCVDEFEGLLRAKGVEVKGPDESCDAVICYCGIRLHNGPGSCPELFQEGGQLTGLPVLGEMEEECRRPGVSGCSSCLRSLYQLKGSEERESESESSSDERKSRMKSRDCELMGLTWLLAKNKTAYFPTVTAVFRAFMASSDGQEPLSCREEQPLAVDSVQLDQASSSPSSHQYTLFSLSLKPISYWAFVLLLWNSFH